MIWKPNTVVAAVIERDGKFLLVEEEADGKLVINQPAGHLDPGESLVNAVMRETLEETAWHIEPTALLGIYRWPHPAKDITYMRFAFVARAVRHEPERPLDKEIRRALWMSESEVRSAQPRHRSPQVQRCLDDYLTGICYPLDILREYDR